MVVKKLNSILLNAERQTNSKNVACNNIASSCLALFLNCLRKRHVDNKWKIDTTLLVLNRPTKPSDLTCWAQHQQTFQRYKVLFSNETPHNVAHCTPVLHNTSTTRHVVCLESCIRLSSTRHFRFLAGGGTPRSALRAVRSFVTWTSFR